ncbi:LysR family transcriptional regulator [Sphingomonas sp. QA11]|uniref:LysR family transcriptional regulator n=1 Tax=Sphingomonas sp. QA11 TaxID=2950605 RepID=UPI00234BB751|nr:LysR family transcriptional regulator [Sphingomonas sp. QA11]WCM27404.1 LysR family transcriptional regulator [Sphingomonas sp. QA11]
MRRTRHRGLVNGGILSGRIPLISLVQCIAVAEYLNFRHAANALGVAQSSVSARIKALEENLGVLLFERHARGVRLTEAGRHFVERVTTGIDHLDHAVRTAGMVARGEHCSLHIGIHEAVDRRIRPGTRHPRSSRNSNPPTR